MRLITNAFSQTMHSASPSGCSLCLSRLTKERIIWFEEFPMQQMQANNPVDGLQLRNMQTKTYTYFHGAWGNIYQSITQNKMRSKTWANTFTCWLLTLTIPRELQQPSLEDLERHLHKIVQGLPEYTTQN